MSFLSIPDRLNGQKILRDWFNSLKIAGISVESYLGINGGLAGTLANCANLQASPSDITGLIFDFSTVKSADFDLLIMRKTDTGGSERVVRRKFTAIYENSTWKPLELVSADDTTDGGGITISITALGQVQYTSDSIAGANYIGKFRYWSTCIGGYT